MPTAISLLLFGHQFWCQSVPWLGPLSCLELADAKSDRFGDCAGDLFPVLAAGFGVNISARSCWELRYLYGSMCQTVDGGGVAKSTCVQCQKLCIDGDYWQTILQPGEKLLYYGLWTSFGYPLPAWFLCVWAGNSCVFGNLCCFGLRPRLGNR